MIGWDLLEPPSLLVFFPKHHFSPRFTVSVHTDNSVEFYKCSFASPASQEVALSIQNGFATFLECQVRDCKGGGILIRGPTSSAALIKCEISGCNGSGRVGEQISGVKLLNEGRLVVHDCRIYGNDRGVTIDRGPLDLCISASGAKITNCEIYDNNSEGILVHGYSGGSYDFTFVTMRRNKIFHNGTFGVRASMDVNNIMFEGNMVFENLWWGICVHNNSGGVYEDNEICNNKMGGIKVGRRSPGKTPCVVVNNVLHNNCGPAFDEGLRPFERASFPEELQRYFPEKSQRGEDGSELIVSVPNVALAEFGQNRCENNEFGQVSFKEAAKMSQWVLCFRSNMNVKRCTGCMTATYCGTKCLTLHCK